MIPYEDALDLILRQAPSLASEAVALHDALGRVLAQEVHSDMDIPPFDKSAVDGYACRREDLDRALQVLEVVPAGNMPTTAIGPRQCSKIMTGAPVPEGADCVVMIEHMEQAGEGRVRFTRETTGNNFVPRGEDLQKGAKVLDAGARLRPEHLAVLASMGVVNPRVSVRPRVGVFSTGDELVPPSEKPTGAKIRNSNSVQLEAQLREAGARVSGYGIAPDDEAGLRQTMDRALAENDVVISTGGVSVGDYDLVPQLLEDAGLQIHVRRIAIQPGKPMAFATGKGKSYFGLSGNPFSSFVQCTLFVLPYLRKMSGCKDVDIDLHLPLGETVRRKNAERMAWIPVALREGKVFPVPYHGSAHIHALVRADALIAFPVGTKVLESGQTLPVKLIHL